MENPRYAIKLTGKWKWTVYENKCAVAVITIGIGYKFKSLSRFHPEIHSKDLEEMKYVFETTQFSIHSDRDNRYTRWYVHRPTHVVPLGHIMLTDGKYCFTDVVHQQRLQDEEFEQLMKQFMSYHAPRDSVPESDEQARDPSAEAH